MTKPEIIANIASRANLSNAVAGKALTALVDTITQALAGGDKVTVPKLGVFSTTARAARIGRNPQTGEKIQIASSNSAKFRASKTLKDSVA